STDDAAFEDPDYRGYRFHRYRHRCRDARSAGTRIGRHRFRPPDSVGRIRVGEASPRPHEGAGATPPQSVARVRFLHTTDTFRVRPAIGTPIPIPLIRTLRIV